MTKMTNDPMAELAKAAIEVNLSVPLNISPELNRKLNQLETAIKNAGYNPRKRLK